MKKVLKALPVIVWVLLIGIICFDYQNRLPGGAMMVMLVSLTIYTLLFIYANCAKYEEEHENEIDNIDLCPHKIDGKSTLVSYKNGDCYCSICGTKFNFINMKEKDDNSGE